MARQTTRLSNRLSVSTYCSHLRRHADRECSRRLCKILEQLRQLFYNGDWTTILEWLQKKPDAAASSWLERTHETKPDKYADEKTLRTLQRRIGQWRSITSKGWALRAKTERCEITIPYHFHSAGGEVHRENSKQDLTPWDDHQRKRPAKLQAPFTKNFRVRCESRSGFPFQSPVPHANAKTENASDSK